MPKVKDADSLYSLAIALCRLANKNEVLTSFAKNLPEFQESLNKAREFA
jgi:hypothetical protein